jgi:hypothetical protein
MQTAEASLQSEFLISSMQRAFQGSHDNVSVIGHWGMDDTLISMLVQYPT